MANKKFDIWVFKNENKTKQIHEGFLFILDRPPFLLNRGRYILFLFFVLMNCINWGEHNLLQLPLGFHKNLIVSCLFHGIILKNFYILSVQTLINDEPHLIFAFTVFYTDKCGENFYY